MVSVKRYFIFFITAFFVLSGASYSQTKVKTKAPKFTLTFALGYNFAVSRAFGDVTSFSVLYDSLTGLSTFNGLHYGMQQGGSFMTTGKLAVDKKRRVRLTLTLGYTLFYNTAFNNIHKNQWHLFNGSFGIEYNFRPKAWYRPFIGYELMYTLMFGSWQTGYTKPDGDVNEIYMKFKPAHRFGMAINSGVEFKINKKMGLTLGYRAAWVNIFPKQTKGSSDPYKLYISDAKSGDGIDLGSRKQIGYIQLFAGVSMFIHRK
jgi:hypothetical protein